MKTKPKKYKPIVISDYQQSTISQTHKKNYQKQTNQFEILLRCKQNSPIKHSKEKKLNNQRQENSKNSKNCSPKKKNIISIRNIENEDDKFEQNTNDILPSFNISMKSSKSCLKSFKDVGTPLTFKHIKFPGNTKEDFGNTNDHAKEHLQIKSIKFCELDNSVFTYIAQEKCKTAEDNTHNKHKKYYRNFGQKNYVNQLDDALKDDNNCQLI